jgi:hypothetical protein
MGDEGTMRIMVGWNRMIIGSPSKPPQLDESHSAPRGAGGKRELDLLRRYER